MKTTLLVTGMHCASCAARVQNALRAVPGVRSATVNYAAAKATVQFDEAQSDAFRLAEAVRAIGYGAEPVTSSEQRYDRAAAIRSARSRFVLAAAFSAPLLLFMALPLLPQSPLSQTFASWMGLASLALATPVQLWLGAGFYRGAWSALRTKTFTMDSLVAAGTSVAYAYSLWNFSMHAQAAGSPLGMMHGLYFET
ncbi:MAG TPA: cation transporter, partial [Candidatus Peribacteria bacterium]|nr:cation transporter [Candidatus Peribacteria bacterium]